VTLIDGAATGWGEGVPYAHYGESETSVLEQIESIRGALESGLGRDDLLDALPAGAARAAVDAALWHLEAETHEPSRAPTVPPLVVATSRTVSLGEPGVMALQAAELASEFSTLKLKLGGEGDVDRVRAVRDAAPGVALIADANEAWRPEDVERRAVQLAALGVSLIEQPTAPSEDEVLNTFEHPVPFAADEAFHTRAEIERVQGRYEVVNLKLEKTGGLTCALDALQGARDQGLRIMVGCMLCSSLGIAPALHLAGTAEWVDLDAPYLLDRDREPALGLGGGSVRSNHSLWRAPIIDTLL
ncbi:MAG: enolase C-terminal domain-like protein, partial [Acidobacteriota bacterium]